MLLPASGSMHERNQKIVNMFSTPHAIHIIALFACTVQVESISSWKILDNNYTVNLHG